MHDNHGIPPAQRRVLVVQNSPTSGPRRLRDWLEDRGVSTEVLLGSRDALPLSLDGYAGLVLLGGGFMPDDYQRAPWLTRERDLARAAIAADLPTLGICLGAQLITQVAGGEVRAQAGPAERGSTMIFPTEAGRDDTVLGALGDGTPMIENHEDLIAVLPPDAVLLASSEAVAHQAFRLGEQVRAVQFHPEASAADLAHWDEAALSRESLSLAALIAAAEAVDAENTAAARRLIGAFADEVLAKV